MSLEPNTSAKVVINLSKGPIEVELWAKELPKTCELFLNKCERKEYNNLKVISTDEYVEVINDKSYELPSESHSRISCKRGYLGAIKQGNKYSVDSFFISLVDSPRFQNYNIFGKVVDGWYNMVKISQGEKDEEGNLLYPVSILDTRVIVPYFELQKKEQQEPIKKSRKQLSVNYEDEDEEEFVIKSAYDKNIKTDQEVKEGSIEESQANVPSLNDNVNPDVSASNSEDHEESEDSEAYLNIVPDPEVDSDYDPNLDLHQAESITFQQLENHNPK